VRDELEAVVHAKVTRRASFAGQLVQRVDDVIDDDGASDANGQAPSRALFDDVERPHGAHVARLVKQEVHGPGGVGAMERIAPTTTPAAVGRFFFLR
jgi:hypothetical protein